MIKYITYRVIQMPLILGVIYLFTFFMVWVVPGDPFSGENRQLSEVELAQIKRELHADTWYNFLGHYTKNLILHGDFGPSLQRRAFSVNEIIEPRLLVSVQIGVTALVIAVVCGMTIGTIAAVKRNGPLDWAGTALTMVGISLPSFVIASILMLAFVATLGWFPIGEWDGMSSFFVVAMRVGLLLIAPLLCWLAESRVLRIGIIGAAALIALTWMTPALGAAVRWLIVVAMLAAAFVAPTFVTRLVGIGTIALAMFWQLAVDIRVGEFAMAGLGFRQLFLPSLALSLAPMAYIVRLQRSSMLDVLGADYVRTARAKGLSKWRSVTKHCLRNAFLPILSYLGPAAAVTLTGSFVVETIFNIEGLGRQFVGSITNRDQTLILALVLIYSSILLFMNLLVDVLYAVVDPRIDVTGRPA